MNVCVFYVCNTQISDMIAHCGVMKHFRLACLGFKSNPTGIIEFVFNLLV